MRLGLRAQIVLALSLVFLLAVWSLGFVTLQITRRSAEVSLLRSERSLARALVPVLGKAVRHDEAQFQSLCRELQLHAGLAGLALIGSADAKRPARPSLHWWPRAVTRPRTSTTPAGSSAATFRSPGPKKFPQRVTATGNPYV